MPLRPSCAARGPPRNPDRCPAAYFAAAFGVSISQPPPSALIRFTLATKRRPTMASSARSLTSAAACTTTTAQVGDDARPVLIVGDRHRFARRLHRRALHGGFALQEAQRGEVVLHIAERGENRLPVIGDGLRVGGRRLARSARRANRRPAGPARTPRRPRRKCRSHRPRTAWPRGRRRLRRRRSGRWPRPSGVPRRRCPGAGRAVRKATPGAPPESPRSRRLRRC